MGDGSLSFAVKIILLLACTSYFAAVETAFASVSRVRLRTLVERGDRQAKKAVWVLDNFDKAITTILILVNILHIAAASIVTVFATRKWGLSAVTASTIVTTLVVFFVGEMLPKSLGKKYSERVSLATASVLSFFMKLLTPVSAILAAIGNAAAKLGGNKGEVTVTEDELHDIIENMTDEGELNAEQGELVQSALMFGDVTVETVLTARVDVDAIDIEDSQETILNFVREKRHSRLPVYRDSIDNIIGILQIRKYLKAYLKNGGAVDIESLLDEAFFVHQSANISELLPEMSRKKLNMAVVLDNYGGTLGIVTVEDILEELVGEIWDEDDEQVETFKALPDGSFEIDSELTVLEAFELMDYEDPEDDEELEHKLMGEWAYEQFDLLPRQGESFGYHDLRVVVSGMENHRITKLTAYTVSEDAKEGGEGK